MRYAPRLPFAAVSLLLLFLTALTPAKADTYNFTVVASTNNHYIVAMDDYGDFVTYSYNTNVTYPYASPCGLATNGCYALYSAYSHTTTYFVTQPMLPVAPNPVTGPGCTFDLTTLPGAQSSCTNGWQYVYNAPDTFRGMYAANGSQLTRLYQAAVAGTPLITQNGNLFFYDGLTENLIAGINQTTAPTALPLTAATPEPSTLLLLCTGLFCLAWATRNRPDLFVNGRRIQ